MPAPAKRLVSGAVTLLPLSAEHAADYIALANEPSIAPRVNNPIPFTQANFDKLLADMQAMDYGYYIWMIAHEGQIVGCINNSDMLNAGRYQGGYWISPQARGKGIARTALTLVKDFLFAEAGAVRVQALIEPDNPASQRVVEACGYTREGLLRRFYPSKTHGLIDVYMYAIVRSE